MMGILKTSEEQWMELMQMQTFSCFYLIGHSGLQADRGSI